LETQKAPNTSPTWNLGITLNLNNMFTRNKNSTKKIIGIMNLSKNSVGLKMISHNGAALQDLKEKLHKVAI